MKPLIGITTEEIANQRDPWAPGMYGQKRTYSEAIVAAGGIPIFIPFIPENELRLLFDRLDGILFAGGNDISPALYGEQQHAKTVDVSHPRDQVESLLMKWALSEDKPIFAICRGFQLLNVHLGGTLYQDLQTQSPHNKDHTLSTRKKDYTFIAHKLKLEPNSLLSAITRSKTMQANTHHHQGIKELAKNLRATAWSDDGLIEAIEHPARQFTMGVQCHPESLYSLDKKWAQVFEAFVQASTNQLAPTRLGTLIRRIRAVDRKKIFSRQSSEPARHRRS